MNTFEYYPLLHNDLFYEVMSHLDLNELIALCQTRSSTPYYRDERLWFVLYQKHFGHLKIVEDTWFQQFKLAYQLQTLKIKFNLNESLIQLFQLKRLNLTNNQISAIPKEIGQLQNLEYLYLPYNQIQAIPKEIGQLQNLKELYLYHNQIQAIPKEIGQSKFKTIIFICKIYND